MIAILRARFETNTDPNTAWSDQLFDNWMKPLIPFSLGDFWWTSSRGLFPLEYTLYAPFVMKDPRSDPHDVQQRGVMVDAAIAAATEQMQPDWTNTDILLIWFAQQTDAFGGREYTVPLAAGGSKQVPVTVIDLMATLDIAGQELGHSFGLNHEVDADMRNTLIVELDAQCHLGSRLQGLSNIQLVMVALGAVPA
jgi:hypothetical protein